LGADFSESLQAFFIYRTGNTAQVQDMIYTPSLKPGNDVVLITIDDATLNAYQASSDLKTLTLGKKLYTDLAKKLKMADARGIGWDILFQNSDTEVNPETGKTYEEEFANILKETPSVIATEYQSQMCDNERNRLYNLYGAKEYQ
jgi:CHASE2 domain-containing sensor protein